MPGSFSLPFKLTNFPSLSCVLLLLPGCQRLTKLLEGGLNRALAVKEESPADGRQTVSNILGAFHSDLALPERMTHFDPGRVYAGFLCDANQNRNGVKAGQSTFEHLDEII